MKNKFKKLLGELSAKVGGFRGKHRLLRQFERFIGGNESLKVCRRKVWWELNTQEWIQFSLFWDGQYAGGVSELLARVVERSSDAGGGATVWDVGANIGAVSLPLLARFPALSVEAFEPAPGPLGQLKRHLALNPMLAKRLRLHALALSNEKGELAFYQSAQKENQAIGSLAAMGDTQPNAIQVTCALGDDLIDAEAAARPNLIKIDVEGCELKVLLGLKRTLEESHPVVVAEHSPYRLQQAGIGKQEVRDFMRTLGYRHIGKIGPGGSVTELADQDLESSCDLVFGYRESF